MMGAIGPRFHFLRDDRVDSRFRVVAISNLSARVPRSSAQTPDHDRDGHVVQLYADGGFLIDVLSRFIESALVAGDAAIVIATATHRLELQKRLSSLGVDVNKAEAQG